MKPPIITFRVRRSGGEIYSGHGRLCVCVCLSVPRRIPTLLHGPDVTWENGSGCPLVVHYWADLQSLHGFRCYDNIAPNAKCQRVLVLALCLVTFRVSRRRREMYCGHARLCVCVCVSVSARGRAAHTIAWTRM